MTQATSTEVLKNVRRIEITARRLVDDVFSGQYSSTFKGRGMEFSEVREYLPGDDVRAIDWNVTARMGHPFIKKFVEERELTILFLLDASASLRFGTRRQWKSERAAEILALLAFSALRNNDKVGMILFTDGVEKFVPPRKSRGHALRLVREVLSFEPRTRGTGLRAALDYLNRVQRRRAIVFLLSDFLDDGYEKALRIAQRRHDLIAVPLSDPWERSLPPGVRFLFEDNESGRTAGVTSLGNGRSYRDSNSARTETLRQNLRRWGTDAIFTETGASYIQNFMRFFHERAKRIH